MPKALKTLMIKDKKHSRKYRCAISFKISPGQGPLNVLRQFRFKRSLTHQIIFAAGKKTGLKKKIQKHGLYSSAFLRSKQRTNNQ